MAKQSIPSAEQIAEWRANGFVVTTFKASEGRYSPRGKTIYPTAEAALETATRLGDVNGYLACVDYAHFHGLGLTDGVASEDAANARQPRVKQNPRHAGSSCPQQVSA